MNPEGKGILARLEATDEEIADAWGHAISAAIRDHRRADVPVAMWDDEHHCVIMISAKDVENSERQMSGEVASKTAG